MASAISRPDKGSSSLREAGVWGVHSGKYLIMDTINLLNLKILVLRRPFSGSLRVNSGQPCYMLKSYKPSNFLKIILLF